MKPVAILAGFTNFDQAYSLCRVVQCQIEMLARNGYEPILLVSKNFEKLHEASYPGAKIVRIDDGAWEGNAVTVRAEAEGEIQTIERELDRALPEGCIVLTHDLIYQATLWKYHVAARRLASRRPDLQWLHWVHSSSNLGTAKNTGRYQPELEGKFPNSTLVAMHREEQDRKAALYGYEPNETAIVPNPVDFLDGYDPAALQTIERCGLMQADVIAVYPCRLDRGKQPHVVTEIVAALCKKGFDAWAIIVDFHSNDEGDKAAYREEIKELAAGNGAQIFFTSDLEGGTGRAPYSYLIPHKAVMDLMEVADVLVHPSKSESDPLVLPEAAWKRCGLVLNFDLPYFRTYQGQATFGNFSSCIDVCTGQIGTTEVEYGNRGAYLKRVAAAIAYQMENNPVLALHAKMRKERSLEGVWPKLWATIEGGDV